MRMMMIIIIIIVIMMMLMILMIIMKGRSRITADDERHVTTHR